MCPPPKRGLRSRDAVDDRGAGLRVHAHERLLATHDALLQVARLAERREVDAADDADLEVLRANQDEGFVRR